jgi:uncharacterized CHY-type Zn-finger protein
VCAGVNTWLGSRAGFGRGILLAFVGSVGILGTAVWAAAGSDSKPSPAAVSSAPGEAAVDADNQEIQVPPPPFSEGVFPCSECHADMETNPKRRVLEEDHTDIVLHHDEKHRWCLDCHDAADRDRLRLASGQKIEFERSYLLCGQCHGDKLRDWRAGVHGKRSGHWRGQKTYLLCANCHNPHSPRFRAIAPMPPPRRPIPAR